jgi:hypothetical protein
MFAIEESASSFCAREMRGTLSIASTVTFSPASAAEIGFCAGQMKLTSVPPSRSSATSSLSGRADLEDDVGARHSCARSATISAPAAR